MARATIMPDAARRIGRGRFASATSPGDGLVAVGVIVPITPTLEIED